MPLAILRRLTLLLPFLAVSAFAQEPWDQPPFASDPKALIAAAEKIDDGGKGVVELLVEEELTFDADGHSTATLRMMYRVAAESAVRWSSNVTAEWAPWVDERPLITGRVVTKNGDVHTLDASAITEKAGEADSDIFSDKRHLHGPLPAVEAGAVVEYVITTKGKAPIPGAGTTALFPFQQWLPMHRARLIISGPASVEPRIVNKSGIDPVIEEKDGIRRMVFESKRVEAYEDNLETSLPFDETTYPYVAFSTGASWQQIATQYSQIVDRQIAGSNLTTLVHNAIGNATGRREIISRLLAAIQKDVRYAGVEVAEGTIIPRAPSTVLKNKYGDCKDKATLLVAMLRAAGIPANVVLLRSGLDLDVHKELPGLGRFNHAIVRTGGDDPLWIDPTDEFARVSQLPYEDQGRLALIAAPETTALTPTPELPSSASVRHETRVYTLPENGKAQVVETIETAGATDAAQRRWFATASAKSFKESLEKYVKTYYTAKALGKYDTADPHDLATPFHITMEAMESGSGHVADGEASAAMHPTALMTILSKSLKDWTEPKPDDDPKTAHKPRVHDFVFASPMVKEWTYRIIPPAGYAARPLPKSETRKLGTITYTTEFAVQPDNSVTATMRVDTGKRRITAKEFEETRVAVSKLLREPQTEIGFDLIGQKKLTEGDVAGALGEFRKLMALHPAEAQHHIELAQALLTGGLGDAARAEAQLAVKVEPKNARAHEALSNVLQHDLLGRPLRKGSDIPGAIAELRKANELDSTILAQRVELARLLAYGDDGQQFIGLNARLGESIDAYRALAKDFGDDAHAYDGELMLVLAYAGHYQELRDLAANATNAAVREEGRILATVILDGIDAAQKELAAFALDTRRAYAGELGQYLFQLRRYPEAAAIMAIATKGTNDASETGQFIELMKKARRIEEIPAPPDDPRSVLTVFFKSLAHNDKDAVIRMFAPDLQERARKETEEEDNLEDLSAFSRLGNGELSLPSMVDLVMTFMQLQKDGAEETGYRLRLQMPGGDDSDFSFYVIREDGHYVVRAASESELIGLAAQYFLEKNQPDVARVWLNWGREEVKIGGGDDPLSGSPFAALWPKAKATATADEIRLAAAVWIAEHDDESASALEEIRAKTESEATKTIIDRALAGAYVSAREWEKALPPARRLFTQYPDSETAFMSLVHALSFSGKHAEAEALAKERLAKLPKDRAALRALVLNATNAHDYAAADQYALQVLNETNPQRDDYDRAAWCGILTGNLERALEDARLATSNGSPQNNAKPDSDNAPSFRTLAVVFAESGNTLEARQALLSSIDQRVSDRPTPDDYYVLGRIAETYGVRDAAIAAYKRVQEKGTPGEQWKELAEQRMKGLR
jgi:tetratricopeptide (TPR) repeat protein